MLPNPDGHRDARRERDLRRIRQQRTAADVVDDEQQRDAAQPRRVRLPLEPVQRPRHRLAGERRLLDEVEGAAVEEPDVAVELGRAARRRPQVAVEPVEQQRVADPHDPGDDVHPPERRGRAARADVRHACGRYAGYADAAATVPRRCCRMRTNDRPRSSSSVTPVMATASSSVSAPQLIARKKKLSSP